MSGGSFDYKYHWADDFADELQVKINLMGKEDEYGEINPFYSEAVIQKLKDIIQDCRKIAKEMKEVEWLFSDDIGEDDFLKNVEANNETI